MKKSKILITGVSGLIGSQLSQLALSRGYDVTGLARSNITKLEAELDIPIIELDLLCDFNSIPFFDTIIHCATANDIISKNSTLGYELSVMGTQKLLTVAKNIGVKNFIYMSTAQVYGTELSGKFSIDTIVNCETEYALNHYLGEEICRHYSKRYGMNIIIIRPSNVFGEALISTVNREALVPNCFISQIISKQKIVIKSSGNQMRDFISNENLSEIILDNLGHIPEGYSIVNAASGHSLSIRDIADLVLYVYEKEYGVTGKIFAESTLPKKSNYFEIILDNNNSKKIYKEYKNDINSIIAKILRKKIQT